MRLSRTRRRATGSFDLTPMIDVVMQLLIFFLFTSQFAAMARSPMDLPKQAGEDSEVVEAAAVVIDIQADGQTLIESRRVTREELTRMLQAEIARVGGDPAGVEVLVRADRSASARMLNEIARELIRLRIRNWRLGTQDPGKTSSPGVTSGGTTP